MSNNQLAAMTVLETAAALAMAPSRDRWLQTYNMFCSKKQQSSKNPVAMTIVEIAVGLVMASTVNGEKD